MRIDRLPDEAKSIIREVVAEMEGKTSMDRATINKMFDVWERYRMEGKGSRTCQGRINRTLSKMRYWVSENE